MNKILRWMDWKDYRGRWSPADIFYDVAIVTIIATGISVGVYYG